LTQGSTKLPVIENNVITVESITSRDYVPAENGVVVSMRVPVNMFVFGAGESISITGDIDMKLVGSGRRLQDDIDGIKVNDNGMTSSFELSVALQKSLVYNKEQLTSSAKVTVASNGLFMLGMMLAIAHML